MTCPLVQNLASSSSSNPHRSLSPIRRGMKKTRTRMRSPSMMSPAHPPEALSLWASSPSPAPHPLPPPPLSNSSSTSKQPIDFSPPLIAMVVIAAAAFLIVTYSRLISRHFLPPLLRQISRYRRWRRRRRQLLPGGPSVGDVDSPPYAFDGQHVYGLEDSVIKSMPLSVYSEKSNHHIDEFPGDCAVCLVEFVDKDYVRTLPLCAHSFHVDCIDVWLRSQATCPLCRAGVLPPREWSPTSPFVPVDERLLLDSIFLDPLPAPVRMRSESVTTVPEIVPESEASEGRPQLLKRSYSFGFERNFSTSERLVMEPATESPWCHRNHHHHRRRSFSFWRRPSPFSSLAKPRVFSFRSNRKGPFMGRRRGGGAFVPLSESAGIRYAYYYSASGGGGSKSMASPMFGRSSASSRMRCGDPEALISPERYGSR